MTTLLMRYLKTFFGLKPKRNPLVSTKAAVWATIAIIVTQGLDFSTTVYGVSSGATEANGNMAHVMTTLGFTGFAGVKLLGAAFLSWVFWRRKYAPWIVSTLYLGVAIWNSFVISQL